MLLGRGAQGLLYTKAAVVTPHDSNTNEYSALYIGGTGGNLTVQLREDAAAVTFSAVAAGTFIPLATTLVKSTGTTATTIIGLK